jgi:hypothetical protein
MRVSVVATGIDAEAQGEVGAERPKPVPVAGKGSAPEPASAAFPNTAVPANLPGKPAARPAGSDPGKAKLRFDPDARPSAGPLFPSRATPRPEPAPGFVKAGTVKAGSERAANGDALPGRWPSLAAPDPAERILPDGADRKPPPVSRLPRH